MSQQQRPNVIPNQHPRTRICGTCRGKGTLSVFKEETCPHCDGPQQYKTNETASSPSRCFQCNGTGRILKVVEENCRDCCGVGFISY